MDDRRAREVRVNERVRAREVRLVDEEGQALGIMSGFQALQIARERGLDLVEVSPMANPPVCRLMDYGRFKYEQSKKENEARKRQKQSEVKEVQLTPRTDEHDINVKVRKSQEFLANGDKVKIAVKYRGREMAHPELGRKVIEQVIEALKGIAVVERPLQAEGKTISVLLGRAPGWEPARKGETAPPKVAEAPAPTPDEAAAPEEAGAPPVTTA
jgi:translation initiation factor IF-3